MSYSAYSYLQSHLISREAGSQIPDHTATMQRIMKESADQLRLLGNEKFNKQIYYEALHFYNLALTRIGEETKSEETAALIYANRSAVYLEKKFFKHCLNNIEMALPHYPKDKIQKLHGRREKCLKMMETEDDKAIQPMKKPFVLSHKSNPKLPIFIDAIKLKKNSTFGNHLIIDRDLKAGDVIAVIDNCLTFPAVRDYVSLPSCYNCLDINNFDLKLFDGCSEGEIPDFSI